ncbi:cyclin N-terminal domain-containing protein 2 isoform X2 [Clupea harengus]|uniref:Cyclin N-terminal domain-containing protein 2 isoform X2 n=1 Tax=Clupea harengus TaxID=7950 RepID=A0A6P8FSB9_CLUHA|nr:cyclin N-terminal domain-containing protein 2 isoform X2 [Clupea harengus]
MAQTGFCDSRPLLDLHKKAEETRVPLRTWANACSPKERWTQVEDFATRGAFMTAEQDHRWVLHGLHMSTEDGFMGYSVPNARRSSDCWEEPLLWRISGLQHMLVPGLLRHEMELAMSKLGLIYDRTYAWDIFTTMMRSQLHHTFSSAELPGAYSEKMLAILIDWLIQVHEVLHFSEETLYLTVYLLNRAVRLLKVSISNLQLLGVVCLFLAGKKEECLLPEVSELCHLMENTYTPHQLLRMERRVLCGLEFELSYTPPLHFLLLSTCIAQCSNQMVWMARYLLELSLLEVQCVVFQPIHLAGAALQLARCVLQEPPTPEGETACEATLLAIMRILALAAARAPIGSTRASFLKFRTEDTMYVSKHPALMTAPSLLKVPGLQT